MNISLLLQMAAEGFGERTALAGEGTSLTYSELQLAAEVAAGWIQAQPGIERVAYLGFNQPAFPVALFASALSGKPLVPLNYRLPDGELRALATRTSPAVMIVQDDMRGRLDDVPSLIRTTPSALLALVGNSLSGNEASANPDGVAIQLFTSGTTGTPKAALLRHRHLCAYVMETVEFMGAGEDEAILVSVPPYHIAGVAAVLSSVYAGRRMVQLPGFTPEVWIDTAKREGITHAMLVPTMLGRVLAELEARGEMLPKLRHLSYGGGRMPQPVIERALNQLPHVDFVNAYGLTETSSTIAVLGPEDHRRAMAGQTTVERRRLGSVGKPLPNLELSVRDAEGKLVPAGEAGEIWVRGEQVSGEYAGTNAKRADGWLPTKDAGWLDEEGFLFIDGRLDDVIVRGGENISPGEIEDVLCLHPQVREAAVLGLPDEEWGERIAAVIVVRGEVARDDLRGWVGERLRSTRAPQEIHFINELPYTETGKLLRRVLKADLLASGGADR